MASRAPKRKILAEQKANTIKKRSILKRTHSREISPLQRRRKLEGYLKKYRKKYRNETSLIHWLDRIEANIIEFKQNPTDHSYLVQTEKMLIEFESALRLAYKK